METLLFSARDKWPCPRAEASERRGMKMRPRVAQAGGSGQRSSRPRSTPQRVKNRVDVPIPPGRQGRCTRTEAGRGWFLTCWIGELVEASGPRLCYQVYPARPASQQTLGRRQCSVQTCISTTASCPDPCAHRSCPCPPWSGVMRLNSGDCTPEAQSAQRREWLPACCSCLSGCEEAAVSLVRIGEEQVGTPTPARSSACDQAWASAGTNCTADAVQCPPTLRFAHLVYPHLPRPGWVPGYQPTCLPANLPTCQPDSRMRRRLARGGGQLYTIAVFPRPLAMPPKAKSGRRAEMSCVGRRKRKGPGRLPRLGGTVCTSQRREAQQVPGRALVELWSSFWSSFAGPTRLGRRALLPASVNQDRSAKTVHISQYQFHSTQRSPSAHHRPRPDSMQQPAE